LNSGQFRFCIFDLAGKEGRVGERGQLDFTRQLFVARGEGSSSLSSKTGEIRVEGLDSLGQQSSGVVLTSGNCHTDSLEEKERK